MAPVMASGTLPWRRRRGKLQVALVHRPRYDDWSWAKGKLEPGESFPVAAVRETLEETGLQVRLGCPLPPTRYLVANGGGPTEKEVRYWAAEVVGGEGTLVHEVDEVAWLGVTEAASRLSYPRDRPQLDALVAAADHGTLDTWPLALVRHAKALPRASWDGDDRRRPLTPRGREQATNLVPLLSSYGTARLITSPSVRARDTLTPFAKLSGRKLRDKPGLSEEHHEHDPARAVSHLERLLERGVPAALCSHGPVLPGLLRHLRARADDTDALGVQPVIDEVLRDGMAKGETVLAHLVGTGDEARVVALERHLTPGHD